MARLPDMLRPYPKLNLLEILEQMHNGERPGIPEHLQSVNEPHATVEVYNLSERKREATGRLRIAHENEYLHPQDGEESFFVKATQTKDPQEQPTITVVYEGRFPRLSDVG